MPLIVFFLQFLNTFHSLLNGELDISQMLDSIHCQAFALWN